MVDLGKRTWFICWSWKAHLVRQKNRVIYSSYYVCRSKRIRFPYNTSTPNNASIYKKSISPEIMCFTTPNRDPYFPFWTQQQTSSLSVPTIGWALGRCLMKDVRWAFAERASVRQLGFVRYQVQCPRDPTAGLGGTSDASIFGLAPEYCIEHGHRSRNRWLVGD